MKFYLTFLLVSFFMGCIYGPSKKKSPATKTPTLPVVPVAPVAPVAPVVQEAASCLFEKSDAQNSVKGTYCTEFQISKTLSNEALSRVCSEIGSGQGVFKKSPCPQQWQGRPRVVGCETSNSESLYWKTWKYDDEEKQSFLQHCENSSSGENSQI